MATCVFCGSQILAGRGVKVFHRDGSSSFFCSHKCQVNQSMGRRPAVLKWTARREKGRAVKSAKEKPGIKPPVK